MKRGVIFGKKGSHVGVILSFVIFITFLFFIFTVLQPKINFGKDKQSTLNSLETEITENISDNMTTIFVNATKIGSRCIELGNFSLLTMGVISANPPDFVIKNATGEINLTGRAYIPPSKAQALQIKKINNGDWFFKVYYSYEFAALSASPLTFLDCGGQNPVILGSNRDYTISYLKTENYAFEKKISNLINSYKFNYNNVKKQFSIPNDTEFVISFRNSEGLINQPPYNISKTANVYSDQTTVLYVDENATIKTGFLTVAVW